MPSRTPTFLPVDSEGRRIRIPTEDWELEQVESWTRDAVCLATRGRAHSIYVFWRNGEFEHWYVNFEQPLRRSPVGDDTFDEKLDLIVRAQRDLSLEGRGRARAGGGLGLVDAAAVRAEAARVLEEWPFPTGWEDWRPDPSWPVPQLPEGWGQPRMRRTRTARRLLRARPLLGRLGGARARRAGGGGSVEGRARAGAPVRRGRLGARDAPDRERARPPRNADPAAAARGVRGRSRAAGPRRVGRGARAGAACGRRRNRRHRRRDERRRVGAGGAA